MKVLKKVFYFICAVIATLAVNCKMECVIGAETSLVLNGIYKLYHAFYSYNFSDVLVLIALYILIRYIDEQDSRCDKWTVAFSALLSFSFVVSTSFNKYDSTAFLTQDKFQMLLSGICIAGYYIVFYYGLRLLVILLNKKISCLSPIASDDFLHRHVWLLAFMIIFVCWLPWIIMNYPGTSCPDGTLQLRQYFGDAPFTAHHPPFSTFIMGVLMESGKFIWDANFGFFLYILLQTILGAIIFSYSIKKIYDFGIRLRYCMIGTLFYAILPLWGGTLQEYGKDLLYTEIISLFVICLVNIILTKRCEVKESVMLFLAGLFASLLRNNGIYAVLPTIVILVFYLKSMERKRMFVVVCSTMIVYCSVVKIIYPGMGIQDGSIKEALSIPFLQTARYVDMHEEEVTEYEKEVIESVLDYEALATYNPKHADSVKNTYKGDDSKLPQYFAVWFQMFCKHPGTYIAAFLNKGGGYMAPVYVGFPSPIGTTHTEYISEMGINNVFGEKFAKLFVHIEYATMEMPIIRYFCMAGTYTWIVLVCLLLLLREKIYSGLILFIPEVMNVLVSIASPTWHIRYALPVMAVIPLMIGWTYYSIYTKRMKQVDCTNS